MRNSIIVAAIVISTALFSGSASAAEPAAEFKLTDMTPAQCQAIKGFGEVTCGLISVALEDGTIKVCADIEKVKGIGEVKGKAFNEFCQD